MPFFDEFAAACRGEDLNQQAGYLCVSRIMVNQPVYAVSISPDGMWVAYGGKS